MPLYDFSCADCGKTFELSLSLAEHGSDSPKKICPSCASKNITQVIGFSGGGALLGGTVKLSDLKSIDPSSIESPVFGRLGGNRE